MINFYSNISFDEMMKEISYENYDFYIELQSRINQKIQKVLDDIESKEDETENFSLHSIEAMEYFCSPDLKWIKEEQDDYKELLEEYEEFDNINDQLNDEIFDLEQEIEDLEAELQDLENQ